MALSKVQTKHNHTTSGTTVAASFDSLPGAGSSIIVVSGVYGTTVNTSVDDNQGNSYAQVALSHTTHDVEVWWCDAIASPSGTFTVTVTNSHINGYAGEITIYEVTGLSGNDLSVPNQGESGQPTVDAGSTNYDEEFEIFAWCDNYNNNSYTYTAPTGFTNDWFETAPVTYVGFASDSRSATSTETVNPTAGISTSPSTAWDAVVATFYAAGAPPGASIPVFMHQYRQRRI
jgi:hypothetical protein